MNELNIWYVTLWKMLKRKTKQKNVLNGIRGGGCNFIWSGHRKFNHLSCVLKNREGSSNVDIQGQSTSPRVEVKAGAYGLGEELGGRWVDVTGEVTLGSDPRALEALARTWAFSQWSRLGYWGVFIQGKTFMLTSSSSGCVVISKEGKVGSKETNYMSIIIMQPRCNGLLFRFHC